MARLRKLLYPGESVQLRLRRPPAEIIAWLVGPAVPLAQLLLLMSHLQAFNSFLGILSLLFGGLLAFFLFMGGFQFLIDFAFIGFFFDHWRIAVTDQRILVRRGLMGGGHDEMMRYDIGNCLYDKAAGKIVLTGADRKLLITCSQRPAGRILKSLGYAEAGN